MQLLVWQDNKISSSLKKNLLILLHGAVLPPSKKDRPPTFANSLVITSPDIRGASAINSPLCMIGLRCWSSQQKYRRFARIYNNQGLKVASTRITNWQKPAGHNFTHKPVRARKLKTSKVSLSANLTIYATYPSYLESPPGPLPDF